MFNSNEHEWHILGASHFDMSLGFGQLGYPIRQKIAEFVAGNDKYGQIDFALKQFFPKVDQIDGHNVAAPRNLHFHTDADMARSAIDCLLLDPIHTAAFLLNPTACSAKAFVN